MPTQSPDPFISALPKVELHVHLQGAASVDTVLELSRRHPAAGLPTERDELVAFYHFTDFVHFIEVYIAVNRLVRSPDDAHALVVGLARDLVRQQVRYAEVTVTPYSHLLHGMPGQAVADALTAGRAEAAWLGTELAWVFDIQAKPDWSPPTRPSTGRSPALRTGRSASASAVRRSVSRGPSSRHTSGAQSPSA